MTELYQRVWKLQVGELLIDASRVSSTEQPLDIEFQVEKSTQREPNKVAITIYNMNRDHRDQLRAAERVGVRLEAGYRQTGLSLIFDGDLRDVETVRDGVDALTKIEGEDAGDSYREARIQRSFGPGTTVLTVLRAAVDALGIGRGNLDEVTELALTGAGSTYPEGTVLSGPANRAIDRIVRSTGHRWSVQDGVFQFRLRGQPVRSTAIRLTPGTGLIGSPTRSKPERNRPRIIEAETLMLPGLYPGRVIVLESSEVAGQFLLRKVRFQGSTFANEWGAALEMVEY